MIIDKISLIKDFVTKNKGDIIDFNSNLNILTWEKTNEIKNKYVINILDFTSETLKAEQYFFADNREELKDKMIYVAKEVIRNRKENRKETIELLTKTYKLNTEVSFLGNAHIGGIEKTLEITIKMKGKVDIDAFYNCIEDNYYLNIDIVSILDKKDFIDLKDKFNLSQLKEDISYNFKINNNNIHIGDECKKLDEYLIDEE